MGFDAISCGGTIFFLFLDNGVPPPDTAQSPGTSDCAKTVDKLAECNFIFSFSHFNLLLN
jgi:hypothetical protein